ncbi:MAG: L,D-transpeptidase family protein [Candidatus Omnitrophota bacterium]
MNKKLLLLLAALCLIAITVGLFFLGKNTCNLTRDKKCLPGSQAGMLVQVQEEEAKGNLLAAKAAYQELVSNHFNSPEVMNWQKKIEAINVRLLFSSVVTPGSKLYEIKPGDTLSKIAREFKTTADLIKKSNNFSDDRINPGRKIKVWTQPFNVLVDKSQNILILESGGEVIKVYIVSTGMNNSTPVGNFKITDKIVNPPWFKPGEPEPIPPGSPENILGTRWLQLDIPSYGIHGTTDPKSLGKQVTQGCVRMANADVEELYAIVPVGTEVTIAD